MITFHDVSTYQGNYNMADGCPVVAIKMGGGDAGCYFDSKAATNYINAQHAGKVIIGYWFAGGTDPIHEADYFIKAMSPLAENDILALDWEVSNPDPVGWCNQFVEHVHEVTGVWPLIYMNTSTCTAHDWSPVLANCGLWIADYRYTPDQDVPCHHPYIIHQYTSTPLDTDALFISLDDLKKYGYNTPAPAPEPVPTPTPDTTPAPVVAPVVPQPEPAPAPVEPAPVTEPESRPQPVSETNTAQASPTPPKITRATGLWQSLVAFLGELWLALIKK